MELRELLLEKIKLQIAELEPEAKVILFGSRARGDARDDSDWDLLILVPYEVDLTDEQRFRHKLFDLELEFGQAISTMVYQQSEWENKHSVTPLYENIQQEGMML